MSRNSFCQYVKVAIFIHGLLLSLRLGLHDYQYVVLRPLYGWQDAEALVDVVIQYQTCRCHQEFSCVTCQLWILLCPAQLVSYSMAFALNELLKCLEMRCLHTFEPCFLILVLIYNRWWFIRFWNWRRNTPFETGSVPSSREAFEVFGSESWIAQLQPWVALVEGSKDCNIVVTTLFHFSTVQEVIETN